MQKVLSCNCVFVLLFSVFVWLKDYRENLPQNVNWLILFEFREFGAGVKESYVHVWPLFIHENKTEGQLVGLSKNKNTTDYFRLPTHVIRSAPIL